LLDLADSKEPLCSQVPPATPRANLAPLSAERFGVQFTMDKQMYDQLRYVQSLLGPRVPSRDLAKVFALAIECLKDKLEKQKFGKCAHPRKRRGSNDVRYVPDEVKRAVWERDGGRCTFVGSGGKRCDAREALEFDHLDPVARGGRSTVAGVRLLCRAHNQHAAECVFGKEFMHTKRQRARCNPTQTQAETGTAAEVEPPSVAESDVTPWLRQLGFTVAEARRGAALCAHIPDAALEERVRVALRGLAPGRRRPDALGT
jgi:5-methylcytosine-specific restriction endonuclease McrA